MVTTVLAACPDCDNDSAEFKIIDCDACREAWEERGEKAPYSDLNCTHIECLTCGFEPN